MKKKAVLPFLMMLGTFFAKAQLPTFTVSPNTGEINQALTVNITGNNTTFGKDGSCSGSNCSDLGSFFIFTTGTITMQVPYQSVSLLDSNHTASIDVVLPYISGTWQVKTENGLTATNSFSTIPKPVPPVPSISITPTSGVEGKPLTVTITGTHTNLGYNGSCAGTNCMDIGTAMFFRQSSLTAQKTIPYESVNILDSNRVEVSIILPEKGYYHETRINQLHAQSFEVLEDLENVKYISMSPTTAEAGKTISVSISSQGFNLGYNGSCTGNNCRDLGTKLLFNGVETDLQSINLVDSTHAEAVITVPNYEGTFNVETATHLKVSQQFTVKPKPPTYMSLSTNSGIEGQLLTVTITGTNTKLGYNGSCVGANCIDIGTAMYFSQSSLTAQKTVQYESVSILDSNRIQVGLILPENGVYSTHVGGMYTGLFNVQENESIMSISPSTAQEGETITMSLTSSMFNFSSNGYCLATKKCKDLGTHFLFGNMEAPFRSIDWKDSNHVDIVVTVPNYEGTYTLKTNSGLVADQNFAIKRKINPYIFLESNSGIERDTLKVTITGGNTNLGYNGSCAGANCVDIGNAIHFQQASFTNQKTISFESVNVIDSNHIEVSIVLPSEGTYSTSINGISTNYFYVLDNGESDKYISISPSTGEAGKTIKVTLTSGGFDLGYNGSCIGSNCIDLGTKFWFGSTPVNFQSVNLINSNQAEVVITLPKAEGIYYLETETDLKVGQIFYIRPKVPGSVSISPNQGTAGQALTVTITGNNTNLGYNGSCSSEECIDISNSIYFFTGASMVNKSVYYESVNVLDSNHIQVTVVLPEPGNYYTRVNGVDGNAFTVKEDSYIKHFTMTPNTALAGKTVKILLSSEETNFGYNGSCTGTNCRDLGTELLFGLTSKNIQAVNLIDSNHAEVTVTIPSITGTYALKTKTGLEANEAFTVINKPYPSISISKNMGVTGELLTVTITGNNTNLGHNGSCVDENCIDIGNTVSFFTQSSWITRTVAIQSATPIDSNHIEISLVLPIAGTYKLGIGNINLAGDFNVINTANAVLSGSQTTCNSYVQLNAKFTGTAPWSFKYQSEDGQIKTKSGITTANYSFQEWVSHTHTFTLLEASDAYGPCQISGSATVNVYPSPGAHLEQDTTIDQRSYMLTLVGQSPWVVTLNNNGQIDSLLITENTYTFAVADISDYIYLVNVRDANCNNGHISGLGGLITGSGLSTKLSQLNVYPNPSSGTVNVTKGTESIFYDNVGEQVFKTSQESFDVSHLAPGLYTLHLSNASQRKTIKFVKE